MTTIEIIAKKAGVSRGTVDRVLHDRGQVKPETAERVRAVMEEMDFQPNACRGCPVGTVHIDIEVARAVQKAVASVVVIVEIIPDMQRIG